MLPDKTQKTPGIRVPDLGRTAPAGDHSAVTPCCVTATVIGCSVSPVGFHGLKPDTPPACLTARKDNDELAGLVMQDQSPDQERPRKAALPLSIERHRLHNDHVEAMRCDSLQDPDDVEGAFAW